MNMWYLKLICGYRFGNKKAATSNFYLPTNRSCHKLPLIVFILLGKAAILLLTILASITQSLHIRTSSWRVWSANETCNKTIFSRLLQTIRELKFQFKCRGLKYASVAKLLQLMGVEYKGQAAEAGCSKPK